MLEDIPYGIVGFVLLKIMLFGNFLPGGFRFKKIPIYFDKK